MYLETNFLKTDMKIHLEKSTEPCGVAYGIGRLMVKKYGTKLS